MEPQKQHLNDDKENGGANSAQNAQKAQVNVLNLLNESINYLFVKQR